MRMITIKWVPLGIEHGWRNFTYFQKSVMFKTINATFGCISFTIHNAKWM